MKNEILVNAERGETRVAVLERGSCTELLIERTGAEDVVGSVIKGRVTRVLPGMQAAFVDIGLEKAAFLYAGDYYGDGDEDEGPRRGRRNGNSGKGGGKGNGRGGKGRKGGKGGGGGRHRQPPRIDTLLSEGQEIVVQVAKEPIGTKGARITSNVSIAGRHLVLTPRSKRVGVSRKIDSDKERRRLREIVTRLRPEGLGFITRTAGQNVREADIEADIKYLSQVWEDVQGGKDKVSSPTVLYREPSLPIKVIRDLANHDTQRIVIDNEAVYEEMKTFVDRFIADPKPKIEHYRKEASLFDAYGVESQIDANLNRKVFMKSGGYLIIDQSEALTAIDVNTGSYVGKRDLEETVLRTNLEAVKEIVHQLRFRNIGGLLILDLIDMESAQNRDKVYRALQEELRQDKARTNILRISELGLVEMTRKRTRENLVQTVCESCSYCEGKGYVLSVRSVAYRILRALRADLSRLSGRQVALSVAPAVAEVLLTEEKASVAELEERMGRAIEIRARPGMHHERFEVEAVDAGPPVAVSLPWLEAPDGSGPEEADDDDAEAEATAEAEAAEQDGAAEAESPPEAPPEAQAAEEGPTEPAPEAEEPPPEAEEPAPEAEEPPPEAEEPAPEADEPPPEAEQPAAASATGPGPEAEEAADGSPPVFDEAPPADPEPAPGGPVDEAEESRILPRSQQSGDS